MMCDNSEKSQEQSKEPAGPRAFPYILAHRVAMNVFFSNPQKFFDLSTPEFNQELKEFMWGKAVAEVDAGAASDYDIGDFHVKQAAVGTCPAVIISFPEPCGLTECHMALGLICCNGESSRYFTLEWSRVHGFPEMPVTVLGEWTLDGSHLNYGVGPAPIELDFINVLGAMMVPSGVSDGL